ncbi:MAG TPA: helix-turn-helix domain-containing protein [Elusimicrobiota bacterium]|nr:helix-turn-helix domain-containing protein [Elusimicrobiota bacterium]
MAPGPRLVGSAAPRALQRLIPRLKLAHLMALPEENFGKLVLTVERHPLFQKYLYTSDPGRQLFSYGRFQRSGVAPRFLQINEDIAPAAGGLDVESLLEEKRSLISLCRRIGEKNFERYFLYGEGGRSLEDIARECGVSLEDAQRALDLVTRVGVQSEFYEPASPSMSAANTRIAHIEPDGEGGFAIRYTSLKYARGRYVIHYDRLQTLKRLPGMTLEEFRQIKKLVKTMEYVNARRSTVSRVLETIVQRQDQFLRSGHQEDLRDLTQEELARRLGVHSSTISRIVASKSVLTPWNEERRIKDFLGRRSVEGVLAKIQDLVEEEAGLIRSGVLPGPFRDVELCRALAERQGPRIALRTMSKYRSLLRIPNVYDRARTFSRPAPPASPPSSLKS